MIDKGIRYKNRTGFFLGGGGSDAADYDIGGGGNVANAPSSSAPTGGGGGNDNNNNDDNRQQYSAKQTTTGVVPGGGKAIKDDSGNVVGFEDRKITGDEGRAARQEYLNAVGASQLQNLYDKGVGDSNLPGLLGVGMNLLQTPRNEMLKGNIDFFRNDPRTRKARLKYGETLEGYENYMKDRLAGNIDAAGNPTMRQDDNRQDTTSGILEALLISDPDSPLLPTSPTGFTYVPYSNQVVVAPGSQGLASLTGGQGFLSSII